ncbi:hypothetical protein [uncultured Cetobacterium sp.]|uniref:hypothetical protein n=1 Tax=uncultured Cetobacterium sp. TaxID=527638 RepID=UPI00262A6AC5|nr:hypothetical protein [uncultured Cetobacterium sp.]
MKKLLILLSLTTAMTAFGTTLQGSEDSATMNINATVIKPLTVTVVDHMNFGTVIQGNEATATGKYSIEGHPGETVFITTTLPTTLTNNITKSGLGITFDTNISLNVNKLDANGKLPFDITGTITPTTSTPTGTYEGQIVARVQYQ